ncbi:MAG: hypothetical protein V3573_05395 [Desulfovibrionaceae bacterium]
METQHQPQTDANERTLINEAQLILAEKRTSLSAMRTGIAIVALPMSIVSVLVATSKLYDPREVLYLVGPLLLFCGALICFGVFIMGRAMLRIRHQDKLILKLKRSHPRLGVLIDLA